MTKSSSIQQIRSQLKETSYDMLPSFIDTYRDDPRDGVKKLVQQASNQLKKYQAELLRLDKMRLYERRYAAYDLICGIDEAGRGPLAGPVCAAAVILPKDVQILYLNDSKKLSEKRREALYDEIMEKAVGVGVGLTSPERIDEINILQADYEAMRRAIRALPMQPEILLNDAVTIPGVEIPQEAIIKGDAKSVSIAAASVIAKVTRDRIMYELDRQYPQYGFAAHKGYGTEAHIKALKQYGPSPVHRRSFIGHFVDPDAAEDENHEARTPSPFSVGREHEEMASVYLTHEGHRISARNFRCKSGEIDLISFDGPVLVFTEVKYRADSRMGDPAEAVDAEKKYRICRAADFYRKKYGIAPQTPCRFDVIAMTKKEIRHIKNAFAYVQR